MAASRMPFGPLLSSMAQGITSLPQRALTEAGELQRTGKYPGGAGGEMPAGLETGMLMVGTPLRVESGAGSSVGSAMRFGRGGEAAAEAGRMRALHERNQGVGGTNRMLPTAQDVERLRGGPPEPLEQLRIEAETRARMDADLAAEDAIRAKHPDRYEGFDLGSGSREQEGRVLTLAEMEARAHEQQGTPAAQGNPPDIGGRPGSPGGDPGLAEAQRRAAEASGARTPLEGLPQKPLTIGGESYIPGPVNLAHDAAEAYMRGAGRDYKPVRTYQPVDVPRAQKIAQAFEEMPHAPNDPKVRASYDAMIDETVGQFKALEDQGVKFEFIKPGMKDPYYESPRLAQKDFVDNKHLWVYPTESGFGSGTSEAAAAAARDNPLLRQTDVTIDGKKLLANDVFRIVHDVFGHFKEGVGFRAAGEENAWRSHAAMYSDEARPAMTTETRGQNSWVNYGPHGEKNRTARADETTYADQKIGLLPDWAMNEGRFDPGTTLGSGARDQGGRAVQAAISEIGHEAPAVRAPAAPSVYVPHRGVMNPIRNANPGIYRNPREIAQEAAARVAPEDPVLKRLFGVTRDDLYEMSKGRIGNEEPNFKISDKARSANAQSIMNPKNAQRLMDALTEAERFPELQKSMDAWYTMDPAYKRIEELVGPDEAKRMYRQFNTLTSMASPGSEVLTEINRGTAANMMATRGQFSDFAKYGGMAAEKRGADFPEALRNVEGHLYHSTSQVVPMQKFVDQGRVDMTSPKVPLYIQASGVPQTGFQTKLPIPDAHFTRATGLPDVRTEKGFQASMRPREYAQMGPWFAENVAKPMGLEGVPAQARLWGTMAPQTGVISPIGAPKLELLSQRIMLMAKKLGTTPEKLRDDVLTGKAHASLVAALGAGGVAAMLMEPSTAEAADFEHAPYSANVEDRRGEKPDMPSRIYEAARKHGEAKRKKDLDDMLAAARARPDYGGTRTFGSLSPR